MNTNYQQPVQFTVTPLKAIRRSITLGGYKNESNISPGLKPVEKSATNVPVFPDDLIILVSAMIYDPSITGEQRINVTVPN